MRKLITDETLAYSKAFVFVMENFTRILKAGQCEHTICFGNGSSVTYMMEDDTVIGACVYEFDMVKKQAYIYTAGVEPVYRSRGVYQEIYDEVEKIARSKGMKVINSSVHIDNQAMLASAVKNGRMLTHYRTTKVL